ncbi:hypothetical protein, partial [Mangrovicoccus algicola]
MPTRAPIPDADPEGLIRDAYRIEGIAAQECRAIFLDWSLSIPEGLEPALALRALLERHGGTHPDHPMTCIIAHNMAAAPAPRRRRGRGRGRGGVA